VRSLLEARRLLIAVSVSRSIASISAASVGDGGGMTAQADELFRGRPLALLIGGIGIAAVAAVFVPATFYPQWRSTTRALVTVICIAPWAFSTIAKNRPGAYLVFAGVLVGVTLLVDLMF
jgi:hypothetical protein